MFLDKIVITNNLFEMEALLMPILVVCIALFFKVKFWFEEKQQPI